MLLEIGMGDAYGAGFEFAPKEKVDAFNNLKAYRKPAFKILPGCYTDDTQMSLAIAELLLEKKEWTKLNIAEKFVECFKRDPRLGYAQGFYTLLKSASNGRELLKSIKPHSTRNGAAMRAVPLGYIQNIQELLEIAELQAATTHDTEIGRKSAQAVALSAHYFIYNVGKKDNLTEFVEHHTEFIWNSNWTAPVACCGQETVNALLTVLKKSASLKDILVNSVAFSGDVDTVAATGLGIGCCSKEYDTALPTFLYEDLEDGRFGKSYLKVIDTQLAAL
ncbi:MAG: ADP-ribosylglycohydrolase family protein [Cellvibrionaceae bacterium]|nr:ADP-ribosylglycohydrolase family protein [Cellvibrionaceae bacterium]